MTFFLLLACALCLGLSFGRMVELTWTKVAQHRQTQRIKTALSQRKKALPFQSVLVLVENFLTGVQDRIPKLKSYYEWIASLLKRSDREEFQPHQILGYQILAGVGSFLLLHLLLGTFSISFTGLALGAAVPILWLRDLAVKRERRILRELPNALEVVSLCCEAGLTVEQGIDQYLKNARPNPLGSEFSGLLEQTRSGSSRKAALEVAAQRLQLTDFSLFTTSLIHAEKFGTGVSKTLRQLSLTLRDKQTQMAEKAVQELPVKMILPLVFFIMPVTFLIIFGPVFLQFLGK
jgi:Flp pilus assembly protein TadB